MTFLDEHFEGTSAIAYSAASAVSRRYQTADRDDLIQVGLVWCIEHPKKFREYVESEAQGKLYRALFNTMSFYARQERAKYYGYDLDDEVFYSKRMLKGDGRRPGLLEYVFDREAWQRPPFVDGGGKRAGDPAEGNNWLATMVDVDSALGKLDNVNHSLLRDHYQFGQTYEDIAKVWNVSKTTIAKRIDKAIASLQDLLGGTRPRDDPAEDEWSTGPVYVGTRRAISNAHARAMLENQWK